MQPGIRAVLSLFLLLPVACSDDNSDPSLPGIQSTSIGGTTGGTSGDEPGETPDSESTNSASDPTEGTEPEVPVCNPVDDLEPNNDEDSATVLPNITDEDVSGDFVESILAGDQDVDWFAYMGKDVALAIVDPAGTLATDMSLRLCLFVDCVIGAPMTPDCVNSIYDESPNGIPGCCNTGESAFVSIDLTCSSGGGDDSAYVFMRVDRGHANVCVPYDVEYHF